MECASCFGTLLYDDLACARKFCTTCRCRDLSHANFCACETRETGTPRQGKAKRKRTSIQKNVLSPSALALHQFVTTESTTQATMAYFEFASAHFCPLPGYLVAELQTVLLCKTMMGAYGVKSTSSLRGL